MTRRGLLGPGSAPGKGKLFRGKFPEREEKRRFGIGSFPVISLVSQTETA